MARRRIGRPSLPIFGLLGQKNIGFSGEILLVPSAGGEGTPGACEELLLNPMPKSLMPNRVVAPLPPLPSIIVFPFPGGEVSPDVTPKMGGAKKFVKWLQLK